MGLRRIIALDLGKFKTVACVMDALDRSHVFETIEMSPAAMHDLLARHATDDPRVGVVGLPPQRLGALARAKGRPRQQGPAEDRDRRPGQTAADDPVGDAPRRPAVPRAPADGPHGGGMKVVPPEK